MYLVTSWSVDTTTGDAMIVMTQATTDTDQKSGKAILFPVMMIVLK